MGDKKKSAAKRGAAKRRAASNKKRSSNRFKEGGTSLDMARNAASKNKKKPVYSPKKRRESIKAKTKSGYYKSKGQTPPPMPKG